MPRVLPKMFRIMIYACFCARRICAPWEAGPTGAAAYVRINDQVRGGFVHLSAMLPEAVLLDAHGIVEHPLWVRYPGNDWRQRRYVFPLFFAHDSTIHSLSFEQERRVRRIRRCDLAVTPGILQIKIRCA